MQKPSVYIETKMEFKEGFSYKQPTDYCNGKELTSQMVENFEDIFGVSFSTAKKESNFYNNTKRVIMFDSDIWSNNLIREKAFNKVYEFYKKGKSGNGSSVTPLLPFEIRLLNNGFTIEKFAELNAYFPRRCYKKENERVILSFDGIRTSFIVILRDCFEYEIDNSRQGYHRVLKGQAEQLK